MINIQYQIIKPGDDNSIHLVANWYLSEWNIPLEITIQKLNTFTGESLQFQVLITADDLPVATGGLYNHVGLLDREPRFKVYRNWLALIYATPENRNKGYGALLCNYIQQHSKAIGLKEIFLFTHTAENLYRRLGWQQLERLTAGGKKIVVMKKDL